MLGTLGNLTMGFAVEAGTNFHQEINRAESAVQHVESVARTSGEGFGRGITTGTVAAGMALGTFVTEGARQLVDITRGFVTAAEDSDKALAQQGAVLKSTGDVSHVTAGHLNETAEALMRSTGISLETIQTGQNMLLTFSNVRDEVGKGNDIYDQATRTVLDMSTALGQDAKSSAIQLGKALSDPVKGITALHRVGVTFTDQQKAAIATAMKHNDILSAQKIILKELATEFGGSAKAFGDSSAGTAAKLQNTWGEIQKSIGHGVLDIVSLVMPLVSSTAGVVEEFFGKVTEGVKVFTDDLKAGMDPLDAMQGLLSKVFGPSTGAMFIAVANVASHLVDALQPLGSVLGNVVKIVGALIPKLQLNGGTASEMGKQFDVVHTVAQKVADAFKWVADNMDIVRPIVYALIAGFGIYQGVVLAVNIVTGIWTGLQAALNVVLLLNPIGIVVVAIVALVAGVILAYQHVGWFHDAVNNVWGVMKSLWSHIATALTPTIEWLGKNVLPVIVSAFNLWLTNIRVLWDVGLKVGGWLLQTFGPAISTIAGLIGKGLASDFQNLVAVLDLGWKGFQKLVDIVKGPVTAALGGIKGVLDGATKAIGALDPTVRHSPSLVDNVLAGTAQIRAAYQGVSGLRLAGPTVGGISAGSGLSAPGSALSGASATGSADSTVAAKLQELIDIWRAAAANRPAPLGGAAAARVA